MVKSLRTRRAVVAATTAVSLATGASAPVQASDVQNAYYAHTRNCIGLFFSDKDAHTDQCLPNPAVSNFVDGMKTTAMVVVAPPPPPPPVVIPTSSYPSVSSSYPSVGSGSK